MRETHASLPTEQSIRNNITEICDAYLNKYPTESVRHNSHKHVNQLQQSIDLLTTLELYKQETDPGIKSAALIYQLFICVEELRFRGFKKKFLINYAHPLCLIANLINIGGYSITARKKQVIKDTAMCRTFIPDTGKFRCAVEDLLALLITGEKKQYSNPKNHGSYTERHLVTEEALLKKFQLTQEHRNNHALFNLPPTQVQQTQPHQVELIKFLPE